VRVLSATNEPLEKRIKEGTFREDLYYRLNVIPIPLPSLRERKDDIPLLVAHFLKDKAHSPLNRPFQVTRKAMEVLCAHDWPGNVRELENAIERAATLAETEIIQAADLPPSILEAVKMTVPTSAPEPQATAELPSVSETTLFPLRAAAQATGERASQQITADSITPLKTFLREQEQAHLQRAMDACGGDKEKAAILLGVSLATLYRKLTGEDKEG